MGVEFRADDSERNVPVLGIEDRSGSSHAKSDIRGYEGNENSRNGIELASIRKLVIQYSHPVVETGTAAQ